MKICFICNKYDLYIIKSYSEYWLQLNKYLIHILKLSKLMRRFSRFGQIWMGANFIFSITKRVSSAIYFVNGYLRLILGSLNQNDSLQYLLWTWFRVNEKKYTFIIAYILLLTIVCQLWPVWLCHTTWSLILTIN